MLVNFLYFTAIWYIYGHLIYFVVILVYFSRFGMLCKEKSGNPGMKARACQAAN
jgi:hypothetical protein